MNKEAQVKKATVIPVMARAYAYFSFTALLAVFLRNNTERF